MSRILAIDPGRKRLGYALSDDSRITARPLEVWKRKSNREDLDHLAQLVGAHEVTELVIGVPYTLEGNVSASTEFALKFVELVRQRFPELTVTPHDEALTSWEAESRLAERGLGWEKRKELLDAFAALVLLEEVLQLRNPNLVPEP